MCAWCSGGIGELKIVSLPPLTFGVVCVCVNVTASRSRSIPAFAFSRRGHFFDHRQPDAEVVDRDQHERLFFIGADGERLGPDPLRDAFRFACGGSRSR